MTVLLILLCWLALVLPLLAVVSVVGAGIKRADAEAAVVAEAERILAGARWQEIVEYGQGRDPESGAS